MENLNIALIGCGMIGREHIERIQNRIRGAQVVAVCDVFEEGAKKGAEIAGAGTKVYTDFNEAINDPDVNAVVVTTPGQFHKGPVLAAIKAGKPVFSEKPLANTAADGKEIVEAEMAGGKHLVQVGFMRRYDRGYRQVKELIDSGKFGAPMVIKCTHRADGVADDYTTAMAVTDTAIHEIDVLPWLVNDEWDEVQCIMPKTNSKVKNALKDPQIMIMKTKGGIINMLEVNVNCGFGYDINCEVVCENGVVNLPCPSFPTVRYANGFPPRSRTTGSCASSILTTLRFRTGLTTHARVRPAAPLLGTATLLPSLLTLWLSPRPPVCRRRSLPAAPRTSTRSNPPRIFYSLLLTRKGGRASCFTALAYHLNHYTAFYNAKLIR